jgi:hypothetical protein
VIPALADTILKDEGSGVLNWALEGLKQHRENDWHFKLTTAQTNVVDKALLEADSENALVEERKFAHNISCHHNVLNCDK